MAQRIVSKLKGRTRKTISNTSNTSDIYAPLDPKTRTIRLLHLQPGAREDKIRAELQMVTIEQARRHYITISYNWGLEGVAREVLITCNGKRVSIKENLATALRKLRRPDHAILLWADALCINQSDSSERTQQVRMMGEIYSNSLETIIWLGEPRLGEDVGSRFLQGHASQIAWRGNLRDHQLRNEYMLDFERSCTTAPVITFEDTSATHRVPDIFGAFCLIQDFAEGKDYPVLNLLNRNNFTTSERMTYPRRHGLIATSARWHGDRSLRVWGGLERLMGTDWVHLSIIVIRYRLTIKMAVAAHLGHPRDCALKVRHNTLRHAFGTLVNVC
jgi:hypothetical protein